MSKKNITIDELADLMQRGFAKAEKDTDEKVNDLAVMVQKGFDETHKEMRDGFKIIDKRFEQVDKHFEQVDKRLEGIESTMVTKAEMNRRFDGLEDRVLASHQNRIEKLEAEVKDLRGTLAT
jgi:hypothetical protein